MKKVIMIILGISLFLEAEFYRDDSKGIVTDSITTLQWQDDYGLLNPEIKKAEWADAIDYCNDLVLGGYSDWRLPNINELSTLIIFEKSNPAMSNVFVYISTWQYWSSTFSFSYGNDYRYAVIFYAGTVFHQYIPSNLYVRCVRAGQ